MSNSYADCSKENLLNSINVNHGIILHRVIVSFGEYHVLI